MDKVQLTSSARPLGEISQTAGLVGIANIPAGIRSVRFVEVTYRKTQVIDSTTGSFIIKVRPEVKKVTDVPVTEVEGDRICSIQGSNGNTMLAYGLIPSATGVSRVDFDNIHTPNDEEFVGAIELDQMVRDGEMVETMTLGVNIEYEEPFH